MSSNFTPIEYAVHSPSRNESSKESTNNPASASRLPPADILVDGLLAYTFGAKVVEYYFSYLLKGPVQRSLLRWQVPGWPWACFTSQGVLDAATSREIFIYHERDQPPARMLDYDARNLRGTVVPQTLWSPQSQGAVKKYVMGADLQWPIFFVREDRTLGLPLLEAIEGPRGILGGQTYAPLGGQSTFHLRVKWPGYEVWKRQVQARDDTRWRNPITMSKFAQHVGRCVSDFFQDCEGRPTPESKWKVGAGGIVPSEVIVLGAVHVSSGTWQPILALTKVVM